MAGGGWFGPDQIRAFDGGLFDDDSVLELDGDSIEILVRVSRLDWSSIEPSILSTLFERSLDPSKRAQIGAHYTSKEDILLIVELVLMAPLRRRWAGVQAAARELVDKRDAWLNPPGASEAELKRRTLTALYNGQPAWLDLAHQALDEAVLDAYGWPHNLSDEEILERLLALNLARAAARPDS